MTTITVPLNADMLEAIQKLIESGVASNKADAVRRALKQFIEDQEVKEILLAAKEPRLRGNIDELAAQLS